MGEIKILEHKLSSQLIASVYFILLLVKMISEQIYLKLFVACIVKWVLGTIEHKHFSKTCFLAGNFKSPALSPKGKKSLSLTHIANAKICKKIYPTNMVFMPFMDLGFPQVYSSDWACCINESACGDCVKGYPIAYTACWLKHRRFIVCVQSTWQDTNNPKVISPLTADFKWSRSYQSSQMEINFVSEC